MNYISFFLIAAFLLQTIAYFPFLITIYNTKTTNNIPNAYLFILLLSNLLFVSVALLNNYYLHSSIFILNCILILTIAYFKNYLCTN
jgi:uncharacterized protein with PQ loop repeat